MKVQYICEGCGEKFDDINKAIACEATEREGIDDIEVGDIVLAGSGCTWFNGDKRWIANANIKLRARHPDDNCFGPCCTYQFFYVVTMIDEHEHRARYHLRTRAMADKSKTGGVLGRIGGYTFNVHHITPKKIDRPGSFLINSGRRLIDWKSEHLL